MTSLRASEAEDGAALGGVGGDEAAQLKLLIHPFAALIVNVSVPPFSLYLL